MEGKTHSELGASKAERWMACPGSVAEAAKYEEPPSSEYAIEGTHAHTLGETALSASTPPRDFIGRTLEDHEGAFAADADMADAVEVYYETVCGDMKAAGPGALLFIETGFDLAHIHPDLYGTNDAAVYDPATGRLRVYDYKHGRGKVVEVERNPQLLYYALGAIRKLGHAHPVREVEIVVVQPRCPHPDGPVRRWLVDPLELFDWEADLADAVALTGQPDAPLAAGDHCRWCAAAPGCPELLALTANAATEAFSAPPGDDPLSYSPDQTAEFLGRADVLEIWIKRVREYAYQIANQGGEIPGFKLVDKQGRAKWTDEETAGALLWSWGYDDSAYFNPPKLRTPAQVLASLKKDEGTKEGGKREKVPAAVEKLIERKSSGTALVPESDKREAVAAGPRAAFNET